MSYFDGVHDSEIIPATASIVVAMRSAEMVNQHHISGTSIRCTIATRVGSSTAIVAKQA